MTIIDILGLVANLISLIAISLSVYVFFTDQFRRWLFFGYKPTAVVLVIDDIKNEVLLIKRDLVHNTKRDYPWHFPQGGIYSSDINTSVNNILNREFNLEPNMYEFEKVIILGTKKIKKRKIYNKYNFGSFSFSSTLNGKGYVCCVVYADLKDSKKKIKLGHGLTSVKIVSFNEALKIIDPQKALMIEKVSKQILDRTNN